MNTDFLNNIFQPAVIVAIIGAVAGMVRYVIVKHQERQSVNRALLSEISRLLMVFAKHEKWWQGCIKDGNVDLPLIPFSTDVADELIKSWTAVDPMYAGYASRFYGYVKFLNRLQATRIDHAKINKPQIFVDTYKSSLEGLSRFKNEFDQAFEKFDVEQPKSIAIPSS